MSSSERWLTWLLRLGGCMTGSAIFAVFLPTTSMNAIHESLGMGALPAAPITEYLTRSLSAMYAVHGALLLGLSTNVRRYRPIIVVLGWATAVLGGLLLGVDLGAPMPWWWTMSEGVPVIGIGLALVWLARRLPGSSPSA